MVAIAGGPSNLVRPQQSAPVRHDLRCMRRYGIYLVTYPASAPAVPELQRHWPGAGRDVHVGRPAMHQMRRRSAPSQVGRAGREPGEACMGRAVRGEGTGARRTTTLANICRVSGFTAAATGLLPTVTTDGTRLHPEFPWALQAALPMTDTVVLFGLASQIVSVARSAAVETGRSPAGADGAMLIPARSCCTSTRRAPVPRPQQCVLRSLSINNVWVSLPGTAFSGLTPAAVVLL